MKRAAAVVVAVCAVFAFHRGLTSAMDSGALSFAWAKAFAVIGSATIGSALAWFLFSHDRERFRP